MASAGTIRELFAHNDWGRAKLLSEAGKLGDPALDRRFEIGPGSMRDTLHHLWAAERVWLDRWLEKKDVRFIQPEAGIALSELERRFRDTSEERTEFFRRIGADGLRRKIAFSNARGESYTFPIGDMAIHVANHGVHHRAQLMNMLRHVGGDVPKPGIDYLFMRMDPTAAPPERLDIDTIRAYFRYGDWANGRVMRAARVLTDVQLDRVFEMGIGTLRKTLAHLLDAERWWLGYWRGEAMRAFPPASDTIALSDLSASIDQTSSNRRDFIAQTGDDDLTRPIVIAPAPGRTFTVPIGQSMLQLCVHGTHHRAQALNMLRHVGGEVMSLDYITWMREGMP